jgi:carbonic anhydrase
VAQDARPSAPVTPQEALRRLVRGNRRFAADGMRHPRQDADRRRDVASKQDPFAQIFSCIDSRVPPEIVFDQGLGDLFVIRTGAQTLDDLVQGSVEYGPLEYGTPLIVVMGHQRCGAVVAAVDSLERGIDLGPHLDEIVTALEPAYNAAKASGASRSTGWSTRRPAGRPPSRSRRWRRIRGWRR